MERNTFSTLYPLLVCFSSGNYLNILAPVKNTWFRFTIKANICIFFMNGKYNLFKALSFYELYEEYCSLSFMKRSRIRSHN